MENFSTAKFDEAKLLLENSKSILLTTHERTDGDDGIVKGRQLR